eukprot:s1958_g8.t1
MKSVSAHWDLELADEVRQCPLRSGAGEEAREEEKEKEKHPLQLANTCQKSEVKRTLYLQLTPLTSVDSKSSAEKLKLWGFWYRKPPDDQKYVKANDLFSAKSYDIEFEIEIPEPMQNGHPIWSICGGPEFEPMTFYTLANGEETKPAPSECLKKETLKKRAGLRVCPDKMTRFFCDCKGQVSAAISDRLPFACDLFGR